MSNMSAETFSTCKLLDVRGLRVSFDAVDVLHGVDLTVHCGRIHALIGESGSGKSVLARSILGLAGRGARTTGSIRFLGRELVGLSEREYRAIRGADIGLVVQDAMSALNPMRTIGEQLVETIACRHPDFRSGASLDVSIQAQVLELLLQLRNRMKMAMLFVSHNLSVVRCICDRVTVMYLGRIVESGTVEAVFSRPLHPYTKLLMASTPGADAHVVRYYPKGAMPSPIDRPKGCVFASRCPLAEARCRTDVPPLRDDGSGHLSACFSGPSFLLHPEA